jgi:hypothetical protein
MSSRPPLSTQRFVLWRVYNRICAYDNLPIDTFAEMEIDHIIPQHLLQTPQQLQALLAGLGVPDLDLNSYDNWLPVHGRCNRDKGGELQPEASLHYFLGVARRHGARARAEELRLARQAKSENHVASIAYLIETGELSLNDVLSALNSVVPRQAGESRKISEIRWAESGLHRFLADFKPSLQDVDAIKLVLLHIRDDPYSTRSRRIQELPPELSAMNEALYVARAGLWRVFYSISNEQLLVVHVDRRTER